MEIKVIVWDGDITRAIARETFSSIEELNEFMETVRQLDARARYTLLEVKR